MVPAALPNHQVAALSAANVPVQPEVSSALQRTSARSTHVRCFYQPDVQVPNSNHALRDFLVAMLGAGLGRDRLEISHAVRDPSAPPLRPAHRSTAASRALGAATVRAAVGSDHAGG